MTRERGEPAADDDPLANTPLWREGEREEGEGAAGTATERGNGAGRK